MLAALEASVIRAGGTARDFPAPKAGELAGWLAQPRHRARRDPRARRRRRSSPGASAGSCARATSTASARARSRPAELEKLALYRQAAPITVEDVRALVPEVIPDSTWAMLDAVADRRTDIAGPLLDRLLETHPAAGDHRPAPPAHPGAARRRRPRRTSGARPGDIVKAIGGHPFRRPEAGRSRRAAGRCRSSTRRSRDVLELDAMIKGAVGSGSTERQVRLAFALWVRERVADAGAREARAPPGRGR